MGSRLADREPSEPLVQRGCAAIAGVDGQLDVRVSRGGKPPLQVTQQTLSGALSPPARPDAQVADLSAIGARPAERLDGGKACGDAVRVARDQQEPPA